MLEICEVLQRCKSAVQYQLNLSGGLCRAFVGGRRLH
jgi:hypothetical protein